MTSQHRDRTRLTSELRERADLLLRFLSFPNPIFSFDFKVMLVHDPLLGRKSWTPHFREQKLSADQYLSVLLERSASFFIQSCDENSGNWENRSVICSDWCLITVVFQQGESVLPPPYTKVLVPPYSDEELKACLNYYTSRSLLTKGTVWRTCLW